MLYCTILDFMLLGGRISPDRLDGKPGESTTRSTTRRARRTTPTTQTRSPGPSATKTSEQSPRFYATNASGPVMDARQESASNPFGMDEKCENCPELCEARTTIAHGYGDVGAGSSSSASHPARPQTGRAFPSSATTNGPVLADVLAAVDMCGTPTRPSQNSRTPFSPTQRGVAASASRPTVRSELRAVPQQQDQDDQPGIIVPVGQRPLDELAFGTPPSPKTNSTSRSDTRRPSAGAGSRLCR